MTYELTINVPFDQIADTAEKLNLEQIYNLYYNLPIEITKVDNGFSFIEDKSQDIALKIFIDEQADNFTSVDDALEHISSILKIKKEDIAYTKHSEEFNFKLEDIDLNNGWVISYSLKDYPNKKTIKFDPQAAFGTGLHVTTQSLLRIILNEDFTDLNVLDLGTGSGILSIAAGIKNAKYVESVDIEPVEREVILNAKLNNVDTITVKQADLLTGDYQVNKDFDWIFINIGASETLTILDRHKLFSGPNKKFLISGVVDWNYERIITKFEQNGYSLVEKSHLNDWVTLLFTK